MFVVKRGHRHVQGTARNTTEYIVYNIYVNALRGVFYRGNCEANCRASMSRFRLGVINGKRHTGISRRCRLSGTLCVHACQRHL